MNHIPTSPKFIARSFSLARLKTILNASETRIILIMAVGTEGTGGGGGRGGVGAIAIFCQIKNLRV